MDGAGIRVLCADDHRLVRDGIAMIIERQRDMEVIGLAGTADEAVAMFRQCRPDVTLMDLQMGNTNGIDAIRAIRVEDPLARIVVLTMYQGDEDIHRALEAGAATYLLKDAIADELVRVIRQVHTGQRPAISDDLQARLQDGAGKQRLTPREVQVLELISEGMRNKEIAAALGVAEETVQVHVKNILAKLEVKDRTAAVRAAARRGIIHMV